MIGIYGGTFDPVHYGHLRTAVEVKELFSLHEIRLIPCHRPPHREKPSASPLQRLDMLKLAIKGAKGLKIDTRELEREGPSFMIDTLQSLKVDYPDQPLILFLGSDAFSGFTSWHRWESIFDYANVVVMNRPTTETKTLPESLKKRLTTSQQELSQHQFGRLFFQNVTQLAISASKIRQIISEKRNPSYLLADKVIAYIENHKIYQDS